MWQGLGEGGGWAGLSDLWGASGAAACGARACVWEGLGEGVGRRLPRGIARGRAGQAACPAVELPGMCSSLRACQPDAFFIP